MSYSRLNFNQYFIDTSRGLDNQKVSIDVNYKEVHYTLKNKVYNAYYCVLYNESRDVIQVYLKETTDDTGWRANFMFAEDYYDSFEYNGQLIQLQVHKGWNVMYRAMKHYIRDEFKVLRDLHPNCEVEIIGWSLGSGQAQLCCQDLFYNFNVKSHVFTFGSVKPWYGKDKIMRDYLKECYVECYNFRDVNDIVGYMPPFGKYFMFNSVKVKQDNFCIFRLFNPYKYHTQYYKDLYKGIK